MPLWYLGGSSHCPSAPRELFPRRRGPSRLEYLLCEAFHCCPCVRTTSIGCTKLSGVKRSVHCFAIHHPFLPVVVSIQIHCPFFLLDVLLDLCVHLFTHLLEMSSIGGRGGRTLPWIPCLWSPCRGTFSIRPGNPSPSFPSGSGILIAVYSGRSFCSIFL